LGGPKGGEQGEVEGIWPWEILGAVQTGGAQCFDKVCPGSARKSADKNFQKLFFGGCSAPKFRPNFFFGLVLPYTNSPKFCRNFLSNFIWHFGGHFGGRSGGFCRRIWSKDFVEGFGFSTKFSQRFFETVCLQATMLAVCLQATMLATVCLQATMLARS
jgi:hypothetical protein